MRLAGVIFSDTIIPIRFKILSGSLAVSMLHTVSQSKPSASRIGLIALRNLKHLLISVSLPLPTYIGTMPCALHILLKSLLVNFAFLRADAIKS